MPDDKLTLIDGRLRVEHCHGGALVLSPSSSGDDCCCCWEKTVTFETVTNVPGRECDPQVKQTKNVQVPENVCIPACAQVSWAADDDIEINGIRLNNTCVAGGGTKRICIDNRSITLNLIDTVGINFGGTITIRICPQDCGCDGVTPLPAQGNCSPGSDRPAP